jgi:hypothetical protein
LDDLTNLQKRDEPVDGREMEKPLEYSISNEAATLELEPLRKASG